MAKNIVICCDGTGNAYGENNSNVVMLFQSLALDDPRQVGYYHPGVGTEGSPTARNRLEEWWSVATGFAFGTGLLNYVGDAYRFLMNMYEEGDRIYLFGFSRGAYTVRALAGMLHIYGLLHAGNEGLVPYIVKMFSRKTRKAAGMSPTLKVAEGFKQTFSRDVKLHLVGVWDTVNSVGMVWDPLKLPYTGVNPSMIHGLHALSIDERRSSFRNNLWGHAMDYQTIRQVWFAGVHSDVGGSYPPMEQGLSQITLEWMLCEAEKLGLMLDPEKVNGTLGRRPPAPPVVGDPAQRIHKSLHGAWWLAEVVPRYEYNWTTGKKRWLIPLGRSRQIPSGSTIHESVRRKMDVDPTYRPKNLPPGWESCVEPEVRCGFGMSEARESALGGA